MIVVASPAVHPRARHLLEDTAANCASCRFRRAETPLQRIHVLPCRVAAEFSSPSMLFEDDALSCRAKKARQYFLYKDIPTFEISGV